METGNRSISICGLQILPVEECNLDNYILHCTTYIQLELAELYAVEIESIHATWW